MNRRSPHRHGLIAAIFVGGCAGALGRAGVERALPAHGGWPWGTFAVNIAGTAALAYFATRLQERLPPSTFRRPLLGTGLCGSLTTFSTLQVEAISLARHGDALLAVAYYAASVATGLVAMFVVTRLVRRAAWR
jgi:CrcB protein